MYSETLKKLLTESGHAGFPSEVYAKPEVNFLLSWEEGGTSVTNMKFPVS